jgi:hypothetical protein
MKVAPDIQGVEKTSFLEENHCLARRQDVRWGVESVIREAWEGLHAGIPHSESIPDAAAHSG